MTYPGPVASPAADDYLKTIYSHTEWQDEAITPSALAAKLGVAPSSVTEMVKKLAAAGLVSHVPYGAVRLTPAGEARALGMVRRHRLIETWLVSEFGYAWDEVHDEAEVLEHSDQRPPARQDRRAAGASPVRSARRCDPGCRRPRAIARRSCCSARRPPAHEGRVLRVSDRDPALLRALESVGLVVGRVVTRGGRRPRDPRRADGRPARRTPATPCG